MNTITLKEKGLLKGEYNLEDEDFKLVQKIIKSFLKNYKKPINEEEFPLRYLQTTSLVETLKAQIVNTNNTTKLLVVDIVSLPSELKDLKFDDMKSKLEDDYECKVFLIDSSRQNIQGNISGNHPVYFYKI